MAKKWSSHGTTNLFLLNLNQCAQGCSMPNFTLLGVASSPLSYIWPKHGSFMAKTWSSHGPSNWFFLNLNHCAQGCLMPNFTLQGLSCSPLTLKWPKYGPLWPKHGLNMVLTMSLKLILSESQSVCPEMFHAKIHIAVCIL